MSKYINADELYDHLCKEFSLHRDDVDDGRICIADVIRVINLEPRCPVFPAEQYWAAKKREAELSKRLSHLFNSKFIASFDRLKSVPPFDYARDITEADRIAASGEEVRHGKWIKPYALLRPYCSECKAVCKDDVFTKYCHECGAKMDGEREEKE